MVNYTAADARKDYETYLNAPLLPSEQDQLNDILGRVKNAAVNGNNQTDLNNCWDRVRHKLEKLGYVFEYRQLYQSLQLFIKW